MTNIILIFGRDIVWISYQMIILQESVSGAQKFVEGVGRHGKMRLDLGLTLNRSKLWKCVVVLAKLFHCGAIKIIMCMYLGDIWKHIHNISCWYVWQVWWLWGIRSKRLFTLYMIFRSKLWKWANYLGASAAQNSYGMTSLLVSIAGD